MAFFALALALIAQKLFVLAPHHGMRAGWFRLIDRLGAAADAGSRRDGVWAWLMVMAPGLLGVVMLSVVAGWAGTMGWLLLHAAVLFATIEVRALSPLGAIHVALAAGDQAQFRVLAQAWLDERGASVNLEDRSINECCRLVITRALEVSHRQIVAPLLWYLLVPGVVGPVAYRLAQVLSERWASEQSVGGMADAAVQAPDVSELDAQHLIIQRSVAFVTWPQIIYRLFDALPLRVSAAGFAVVGNFEDAVYCWRAVKSRPTPVSQRHVLQMVGGGALGLRLVDPDLWVHADAPSRSLEDVSDLRVADTEEWLDWQGAEADGLALRSAQGLLWRAVVWWIGVFAVLTAVSGWGV